MTLPTSPISVEFSEEERQSVLLALAKLSIERPGWDHLLNTIACKMDNVENGRSKMYDSFRQLHQPEPRWGIYDHFRKEFFGEETVWEGSYEEADRKARQQDDKGGKRFYEPQRLPDKP